MMSMERDCEIDKSYKLGLNLQTAFFHSFIHLYLSELSVGELQLLTMMKKRTWINTMATEWSSQC